MKQPAKVLIGVLGGAITAGLFFYAYSQWSKTQRKTAVKAKEDEEVNSEEQKLNPEQQKELEFLKTVINSCGDEIKHWIAFKAFDYFSLPKTPEYQNDQFIVTQVKTCCEFIKTIIGRKVIFEYKYTTEQFLTLFENYAKNAEIQALLSPHVEAIELICYRIRPKSIEFPQGEINLDFFVSFLDILYSEFRFNLYHKAQSLISESKNTLAPNQLKEQILSFGLLPQLKRELWEKFKMPTKENLPVETLIQNIISNCYLDSLEYGKKINDIQKNHISQINEVIITGVKVAEFEDSRKHPVDAFLSKHSTYPFTVQNKEVLNA